MTASHFRDLHLIKMKLAPICIPAYARLIHLQQTIEALQKNTLAVESELFVFSDGPKAGDEEKVQAVRDYLKTVEGFKRLEVIERSENIRPENSRQGLLMLLEEYGRAIFMEEDIVTAPSFLEYMNYMLDVYEKNPRIFSIAGYCPPINIPKDYPYDVFMHPRFNPWGFGIWKDRYEKRKKYIPREVFEGIFHNPRQLWRFTRGGLDLLPLVLNNYFRYKDGGDSRTFPQQFSMNMLTVYPTRHLVDNIGVDGSGKHKKKKYWYRVPLSQEPFQTPRLPETLEPNKDILQAYYDFRSGSFFNKIKILLMSIWILIKRFIFQVKGTK